MRLRPVPSPVRKSVRFSFLIPLLVAASSARAVAAEPVKEFEREIAPFLEEHCNRCHNEKKHKGEFRLDTLSKDVAGGPSALKWAEVIDRISSGDMPPEDEPQPKAEVGARVAEWLAAKIKEGEAA